LNVVSRPSLLAEVALSDPSGELRLAAVERIERDATLERVARQAKGKDKRVARRARERLEAMRMETERPARQHTICEELEQLAGHGGVDLVAYGRLQKAWLTVMPAVSDELARRFDDACRAFDAAQSRLQAEAALSARQRELCERIEELQQSVEQSDAELNGMDSAFTLLQRAWQGLAEEGGALNPVLEERFHTALAATEQRRRERLAQRDEQRRLQAVVERLHSLKPGFDASALKRIEEQWRASGGDSSQPHLTELQSRYRQALQQARRQLETQGNERKELLAEFDTLLDKLEAALEAGQLQQAVSANDKLRARQERLRGQGGNPSPAQQKRLQKLNGRMHELRDWRRFGTHHAREALLEQAQGLASSTLEPLKLAEEVKRLRNEWRLLDKKDGPAGEVLWQAFDEAMEKAYAPCSAYYEAQQQERRAHFEAREQYLAELEQKYDDVEWKTPDWGSVEHLVHQARKRWHKLGGVEPKEWRELNKRFSKLLDRFEAHLGPEREREKERREALIHTVEQLQEETDLAKALAETKAAQSAWRPAVSTIPRIEQGLWRRFKAACDAVYARQKEQSRARREVEQGEQARLSQLCGEIETLASSLDSDNLKQARAHLAELQVEWQGADPRVVKRNKALVASFDAAQTAFAQAEATIESARAESERQLLLQKAHDCDAMEGLLFAPDGTAVETRITAWQEMPPLRDPMLERALEQRFTRTRDALVGDETAIERLKGKAQDNLSHRQTLYLQLELLAGIESPAEFAEERMTMQVAMLSDAMKGQMSGEAQREKARQFFVELLSTGPVAPQAHAECAERLQAVLASNILS